MADLLEKLLARARGDELILWLKQHGAPVFSGPPLANPTLRLREAVKYCAQLRVDASQAHAQLKRDAERIMTLACPGLEWLLTQHLEDADLELDERLKHSGNEARALYLFLHGKPAFEHAERRASFSHIAGSRTHASDYDTPPVGQVAFEGEGEARFKEAVQSIYKRHDGSGEFVDFNVDEMCDDPRYDALVTASVCRQPQYEEEFDQHGALFDRLGRKVTRVHIALHHGEGRLTVAVNRGGAAIRQAVANAFAKYVLGHQSEPAAVVHPDHDLELLAGKTPEQLFVEAPDVTQVRVSKIEATVDGYYGAAASFSESRDVDAWDVMAAAIDAPRGEAPGLTFASLELTVDFAEGLGVRKLAHRSVKVTVTRGGVRCEHPESERYQLIKDQILPALGLGRAPELAGAE